MKVCWNWMTEAYTARNAAAPKHTERFVKLNNDKTTIVSDHNMLG